MVITEARFAELDGDRHDLQRVILHLSSDDPARMDNALTQLERLLELNAAKGSPAALELIVNGDGLEMIREETSPYSRRVNLLLNRYHNVAILACKKALEAFKQREGNQAKLLPGVSRASSALDQVIMRLREGWTYVRV